MSFLLVYHPEPPRLHRLLAPQINRPPLLHEILLHHLPRHLLPTRLLVQLLVPPRFRVLVPQINRQALLHEVQHLHRPWPRRLVRRKLLRMHLLLSLARRLLPAPRRLRPERIIHWMIGRPCENRPTVNLIPFPFMQLYLISTSRLEEENEN